MKPDVYVTRLLPEKELEMVREVCEYFFDEEHISEWLKLSKTPEGTQEYLDKYVFGVEDFEEYLELVGGVRKLNYLKRVEQFREPMRAPWLKAK